REDAEIDEAEWERDRQDAGVASRGLVFTLFDAVEESLRDFDFVALSHKARLEFLFGEIEALRAEIRAEADASGKEKISPWAGVWRPDLHVRAGQFATHNGTLWCALTESNGVRPGTAPTYWALMVKTPPDKKTV